MTITRQHYLNEIKQHFVVTPCVGILGPRQCGKTTLARDYSRLQADTVHYFDLEDPIDLARLMQLI